ATPKARCSKTELPWVEGVATLLETRPVLASVGLSGPDGACVPAAGGAVFDHDGVGAAIAAGVMHRRSPVSGTGRDGHDRRRADRWAAGEVPSSTSRQGGLSHQAVWATASRAGSPGKW